MVEVALHKIINMIAVRHGGMATVLTVNVAGRLLASPVARSAHVGIRCAHRKDMVVHVGAVNMMQVARVEIISVSVVNNSEVTTTGSVNVGVRTGVLVVGGARDGKSHDRQGQDDGLFHN
jgi:hypothetical protein